MPIINVELLAGRTQEVKRQIAKEMTEVMAKHASVDPSHVYVIFKDVAPQDWAVGGVCFSDKVSAKQD